MGIIISSQTHHFHPFLKIFLLFDSQVLNLAIWKWGRGLERQVGKKQMRGAFYSEVYDLHSFSFLKYSHLWRKQISPQGSECSSEREGWDQVHVKQITPELHTLAICPSGPEVPRGFLKHRLITNCKCNSNFILSQDN